jgi:hypothetical protein
MVSPVGVHRMQKACSGLAEKAFLHGLPAQNQFRPSAICSDGPRPRGAGRAIVVSGRPLPISGMNLGRGRNEICSILLNRPSGVVPCAQPRRAWLPLRQVRQRARVSVLGGWDPRVNAKIRPTFLLAQDAESRLVPSATRFQCWKPLQGVTAIDFIVDREPSDERKPNASTVHPPLFNVTC